MKLKIITLFVLITSFNSSCQSCRRVLQTNNDITVFSDLNGGIGLEIRSQNTTYVSLSAEKFKVDNLDYFTVGGSLGFAIHREVGNFLIGARVNSMFYEKEVRFMYGAEAELNFNMPIKNVFLGIRTTLDRQLLNKITYFKPSNVVRFYVKLGVRL